MYMYLSTNGNSLIDYVRLVSEDVFPFIITLLINIYTCSNNWGLKNNVNKTKVCVFEKRRTKHNFEWFINNDKIEEVETFAI